MREGQARRATLTEGVSCSCRQPISTQLLQSQPVRLFDFGETLLRAVGLAGGARADVTAQYVWHAMSVP
jgi:hypothetical protein